MDGEGPPPQGASHWVHLREHPAACNLRLGTGNATWPVNSEPPAEWSIAHLAATSPLRTSARGTGPQRGITDPAWLEYPLFLAHLRPTPSPTAPARAFAAHAYGFELRDTRAADAPSWLPLAAVCDSEQQHLLASSAVQRVFSFFGEALLPDERLRLGARATPLAASALAVAGGLQPGPSFDTLLARSLQLQRTVHSRLLEERGDSGYEAFCRGVAGIIREPQLEDVAECFRGALPSFAGLEDSPYRRPCQPPRTAPLPPPSPPPPPAWLAEMPTAIDPNDPMECMHFEMDERGVPIWGTWLPRNITEVVRPWARHAILARLRAIQTWFGRRIGGATEEELRAQHRGRPEALAVGEDGTYPICRGHLIHFDEDGCYAGCLDPDAVPSPFNEPEARALLAGTADEAAVDFMFGARFAFQSHVPAASLFTPPLLSMCTPFEGSGGSFADALASETEDYVQRHWCCARDFEDADGGLRTFSWPTWCSMCGGVPKPNKVPPEVRGIVDMSCPHGKLALTVMPAVLGQQPRRPPQPAPPAPAATRPSPLPPPPPSTLSSLGSAFRARTSRAEAGAPPPTSTPAARVHDCRRTGRLAAGNCFMMGEHGNDERKREAGCAAFSELLDQMRRSWTRCGDAPDLRLIAKSHGVPLYGSALRQPQAYLAGLDAALQRLAEELRAGAHVHLSCSTSCKARSTCHADTLLDHAASRAAALPATILATAPPAAVADLPPPDPPVAAVPSINALDAAHHLLPEPKPQNSTVSHNQAVLRSLVDPVGWSIIVLVFDLWKFFHTFAYHPAISHLFQRLAPMCSLPPPPAAVAATATSDATIAADPTADATARRADCLRLAKDEVMVMGLHSASKWAQRVADACFSEFSKELERRVQATLASERPAALAAVLRRRDTTIPHDAWGTHGTTVDTHVFTDDPIISVGDDPATGNGTLLAVRLLYEFIGPPGINLLFAQWSKWSLGVEANWLGVMRSPALGLVWVSRSKALRILERLNALLDGRLRAEDYRKLVGCLTDLVLTCGLGYECMHFMQGPLRTGGEIHRGLDTLVDPAAHLNLRRQAKRWRGQIMGFAGASILTAIRKVPLPTSAPRVWIRADASVEGCAHPGLGGALAHLWWRFPLNPGLAALPISWHEAVANALNPLVFSTQLAHSPCVRAEADAVSSPAALGEAGRRARAVALTIVADCLHSRADYHALRHAIEYDHGYGAGNITADAASRAYYEVIAAVGAQMGYTPERVQLSERDLAFLREVYSRLLRLAGRDLTDLPPVLLNLDVSPACDDHDGPFGPGSLARLLAEARVPTPPTARAAALTAQPTPRPWPPTPPRDAADHLASAIAHCSRGSLAEARSHRDLHLALHLRAPPPPTPPPSPIASIRAALEAASAQRARDDADPPPRAKRSTLPPSSRRATELPLPTSPPPDAAHAPPRSRWHQQRVTVVAEDAAEVRRFIAESLAASLSADTSRYAIGVDKDDVEVMCDYFTGDHDLEEDENKGFRSTAWRWWAAYCAAKGTSPWRDDAAANAGLDVEGHRREQVLWCNALPWIWHRMAPRRGYTTPPKPSSAYKYLTTVRALLAKHGINVPSLRPVAARAVQHMREYLEEHGQAAMLPVQKAPLTTPLIASICACDGPAQPTGRGRGRRAWDWRSWQGITWKAVVHTAAQTGMRNEELTSKASFRRSDLSCAHLRWYRREQLLDVLTDGELDSLAVGDFAVLIPGSSKCDMFGARWGQKPIWLPFSPDAQICAARALRDMERARAVPLEGRASTPLFRDDEGAPLPRAYTNRLLREFITLIVPTECVKDYTMHSFRIYLCNALAAAGCSDNEIQAALRWASVEALNTYRGTSKATYGSWLERAAVATFTVFRGRAVLTGRLAPLPTVDHCDRALQFLEDQAELLQLGDTEAE